MSRSFQSFIVIGNLGGDPEMRYTPDGTPVCNVNLAYNERRTDPNGAVSDDTTWFRLVAYDKTAEIIQQYAHKGSHVLVDGKIRVRKFNGRDGVERTSVEVLVRRFEVLDRLAVAAADMGEPPF